MACSKNRSALRAAASMVDAAAETDANERRLTDLWLAAQAAGVRQMLPLDEFVAKRCSVFGYESAEELDSWLGQGFSVVHMDDLIDPIREILEEVGITPDPLYQDHDEIFCSPAERRRLQKHHKKILESVRGLAAHKEFAASCSWRERILLLAFVVATNAGIEGTLPEFLAHARDVGLGRTEPYPEGDLTEFGREWHLLGEKLRYTRYTVGSIWEIAFGYEPDCDETPYLTARWAGLSGY